MSDKEVKLNLNISLEGVNTILAGLDELPHRVVSELIISIRSQAQSQIDERSKKIKTDDGKSDDQP